MSLKFSKGFNIVEVMVATTILIVGLVGVYSVFTRTISFFPYITGKFGAAYLTQEGIEIVRNIRDSNWIKGVNWKEGLTHCSGGCEADYKTGTNQGEDYPWLYTGDVLDIDNDNLYSYSVDNPSPYKYRRRIIIQEQDEGDVGFLNVRVIVEWDIKGKNYNIEAESHLYDWY